MSPRFDRTARALMLIVFLTAAACGDGGGNTKGMLTPTRAVTASPTDTHSIASPTPVPPSATATIPLAPPSATATAPAPTGTPTDTPTATPTGTPTDTPTATPTSTPRDLEVLLFTRTTGFRHPSIADAVRVLTDLPAEEDIVVTHTEDPSLFTDEGLERFDVVAFVNTTGDILDDTQQGALERFIAAGGGWVGVHSAADTEYDWPFYGRLVGAYFVSHPILPVEVEVTTEDPTHRSTQHLEPAFLFTDEIYNFDRNPRFDNSILLTIDEAGFIYPNFPPSPSMGDDHPVAWFKEFEGGRSFYTNLGHRPESWDDPRFRTHLLEGIRWAAGTVGYNRVVISGKASNPLALAVAPDGRVFYVERTGEVRVWSPETGRIIDAAVLDVDTEFENGLLGIELDPDFTNSGYVYLYHSEPVPVPSPASGPPGENVLSRFAVATDGTIDLDTRVDLLRVPSERQCCHEGGGLAFAPDGTLFLSTGDNTNPFQSDGRAPLDERPGRERFNSQRSAANPFDLRGKVLRINPDGTIPSGNLFPADGSEGRPEIFVMGCRNPFRITVDSESGRLFWGDVGPDAIADSPRGPRGYDEINFADRPGNYGWPYCIGPNLPYADFDFTTNVAGPPFDCSAFRPALLAYDYGTVSHLALGNALNPEANPALPGLPFTGRLAVAGTFYRAPADDAPFALPAPFTDVLLMTEWTRDLIVAVEQDESGALGDVLRFLPFERFLRPIDLEVGPDGALYVLEYGSGYGGDNLDARVSRVEYSADGLLTPAAVANAAPSAGAAPLTVRLSAAGSRAIGRDAGVAAYEWDVDGDGDVDATGPEIEHTYATAGIYPASLVVVGRSGRRSFPNVAEIVVGNTPPMVTILSPADGTVVPEGSTVVLRGEASDVEDGTPDCDDLVWDIRLGHNSHSHPFNLLRGCEVMFDAGLLGHDRGALFYAVELRYTDKGTPSGQPSLTGRTSIRIEVEPAA